MADVARVAPAAGPQPEQISDQVSYASMRDVPEVRSQIRQMRTEIPRKLTIRSDRPQSREARGHPLPRDRHPLAREAQGRFELPSRPLMH